MEDSTNKVANTKHLEAAVAASKDFTLKQIEALDFVTMSTARFTIASDAWSQNDDEASEFEYVASVSIRGLTADDYAVVDFDRDAQAAAQDANICPSAETAANVLKLYAETAPGDSISGQVTVFKGG